MKKFALLLCFLLVLSVFSGCEKAPVDGETELFNTEEEVYEAMTGAAEEGRYKTAMAYYGTGGAGADKKDARDWYLYAMALDEYNEYGCLGYPLDLLTEKINPGFEPAQQIAFDLRMKAEEFNGVYELDGMYVYICDGKIGVSSGVKVEDFLFCPFELSLRDGVYYWTERKQDGTHTDLYTLTKNMGQLTVSPTENSDEMYSGTYGIVVTELPLLCY